MATQSELEQGIVALTLDDSRAQHADSEHEDDHSDDSGYSTCVPDDDSSDDSGSSTSVSDEDDGPELVDPRPWPSKEMYRNPKGTGRFYYAIPLDDYTLEDYASKVWPGLEGDMMSYGLDTLAILVKDMSMSEPSRIQIAAILPRHHRKYRWLKGCSMTPMLCLFKFTREAFEKRPTAEKVQKIVDALGIKPDWFEVLFWS